MSTREAYRNGSRTTTKEFDKINRDVFAALVKRVDVNPYLMRSCRIDYTGLEESLQLFLVPISVDTTGSFCIAFLLVERSKLREQSLILLQDLMQKRAKQPENILLNYLSSAVKEERSQSEVSPGFSLCSLKSVFEYSRFSCPWFAFDPQ